MKKIGVLIIVLLLIGFLAPLILAQELGDSGLPPELEKIQKTADKASDVIANRNQSAWTLAVLYYWDKFTKTTVGSYIGKIVDFLSPVVSFVVGVKAAPTWEFLIALFFWFEFLYVMYQTLNNLSTFSPTTSFVSSVCMIVIMGIFGIIRFVSNLFITFLDLLFGKSPFLLKILIAVAFVSIIFILNLLVIKVEKKMQEKKKKQKEQEREEKLDKGARAGEALDKAAEKLREED